jgi:uncharacterized protein (TIGR04255 family)
MTENGPPLPAVPERRYARPPIAEALSEIYFTGSNWDSTTPGLFYEEVRNDYPNKAEMKLVEVEVQLPSGQARAQQMQTGPRMSFARRDNSRLIQLDRDLLVVNQLLPYPRYEEWRNEVLHGLEVYRRLAAPSGIDRLGVRYLNRVNIPVVGPGLRMEDYFRVHPQIPAELGGAHGAFMLQVLMIPVCLGHQLTLTLGLVPPLEPNTMTFLLDLYNVIQLAGQDVFGQVPRLLDQAHANVVHTFENAITDQSRGLFGEVSNG